MISAGVICGSGASERDEGSGWDRYRGGRSHVRTRREFPVEQESDLPQPGFQ